MGLLDTLEKYGGNYTDEAQLRFFFDVATVLGLVLLICIILFFGVAYPYFFP